MAEDLITDETIRRAVDAVVGAVRPLRVVLFGSHARGDARPDSDVDLMVVIGAVDDRSQVVDRLYDLRLPRVEFLVTTAEVYERRKRSLVTDELGHATNYAWQVANDGTAGRLLKQTDPNLNVFTVTWDNANTVSTLNEIDPVTSVVHATWTYAHDPKTGYPTSEAEPGRPATVLTYTNRLLAGHVADVQTVTSPRGIADVDGADPDNFQTTFTYQPDTLRLVKVVSPINAASGDAIDLSTTSMTYYANGDLKTQTNGRLFTTGYGNYDKNGIPRQITKPTQGAVDFFGASDATTLITDEVGQVLKQDDARDSLHQVYSTWTYNKLRDVVETTTPWDGVHRRAATYHYDPNGNPDSVKSAIGYNPTATPPTTPSSPDGATPGSTTGYGYDANDLTTSTDLPPNDAANSVRHATSQYDDAGELIAEVEPQGNATTTVPGDYTTIYSYDAGGRQVGVLDGAGRLSCAYYDRYDNDVADSEPNAVAAGATSCPATAPTTYTSHTTYTLTHEPYQQTDVRGKTTTSTYDAEGNLVTTVDAKNAQTDYTYDPAGHVLTKMDPPFGICADGTGTPSDSSCASKNTTWRPTTATSYDADGNVATQTSPRRVESLGTPGLHITSYQYDGYDQRTSVSVPLATGTLNTYTNYDALERVAGTTLATAATSYATTEDKYKTTFGYWPDGSVVSKDDAPDDVHVSASTYSVYGGVSSRTEHFAQTSWSYWSDGSVKTRANNATGLTIDPVAYNYDRSGRTTTVNDPTHTLTYSTRDGSGLPTAVTGLDGRTATYQYDQDQNLVSRDYAGKTTHWTYETGSTPSDLVVGVDLGPSIVGQPRQMSATFGYDAVDQLISTVRGGTNSTTTSRALNAVGLPEEVSTQMTNGTLLQLDRYKYDAAGEVRQSDLDEHTGHTSTNLYTYDGADRLQTDALDSGALRQYRYTTLGQLNCIYVAGNIGDCDGGNVAPHETFAYDPAHPGQQITHTVKTAVAANDYTETSHWGDDGANGLKGNITSVVRTVSSPSTISNTYDGMNRLRLTTNGTTTETIGYDALDRRVSDASATGGVTRTLGYAYDADSSERAAETNDDPSQPVGRWLLEDPTGGTLGELQDAAPRFELTDQLGSTVETLDPLAAANADPRTSVISYDSYGAANATDVTPGSGESNKTTTRYTGQRYDPLDNTTHHGARDYNPSLRSWVQTDQYLDPMQDLGLSTDAMTGDRTLYAGGNPVNMVDNDGHNALACGASHCDTEETSEGVLVAGTNKGDLTRIAAANIDNGHGSARAQAVGFGQRRVSSISAEVATHQQWCRDPRSTCYRQAHARKHKSDHGITSVATGIAGATGNAAKSIGKKLIVEPVEHPLQTATNVVHGTKLLGLGYALGGAEIVVGGVQNGWDGAERAAYSTAGGALGGAAAGAVGCAPAEAVIGAGTIVHGVCVIGFGIVGGVAGARTYDDVKDD